jgi:hypothetical protein
MVAVCPKHIVNVQPAALRNVASAESLLEVWFETLSITLMDIDGYRWISMDIKRIDMMYLTLFKYIYMYYIMITYYKWNMARDINMT